MKAQNPFQIANREAIIGCILAIVHFIWWFGFAYGFGGKDPSQYHYILGFPAWFFLSTIGSVPFMMVLVFIVVKRFFTDIPLDDEDTSS